MYSGLLYDNRLNGCWSTASRRAVNKICVLHFADVLGFQIMKMKIVIERDWPKMTE
jgi:hypothetical protein